LSTGKENCKKGPVFYNIRLPGEEIKDIRGLGIEMPSHRKQYEVPTGTIVASIDRIQKGHVNGWVCVCEEGQDSTLQSLVAIDGTVVASSDIKDVYESPPIDILQICRERGQHEQPSLVEPTVLKFNISFPPVPIGQHEMKVVIDARKSKIDSWIEAYHSPVQFEETIIEPSDKAIIARKDDIITQRNNQLSRIWNEISTQLPWKKSERDAAEISLFSEKASEYTAVILVKSEPQNQDTREAIRKSWGRSAKKANMIVRFILDNQFSGPHKAMVEQEVESSSDIILIEMGVGKSMHVHRVLYGLDRAVKELNAAFFFLCPDKMLVIPDRLSSLLGSLRDKGDVYMGSMKSGPVVTESSSQWFEKEHWRFGDAIGDSDGPQYPRHAKGQFYGFSAPVARFIARNKEVLQVYSNEDVSIGSWMLGLKVDYIDEGMLNCDIKSCNSDDLQSRNAKCAVFSEAPCDGLCSSKTMPDMFKKCAS